MSTGPEIDDSFVSEELLNSAAAGSTLAALTSLMSVFVAFAALRGEAPLDLTLVWGALTSICAAAILICAAYKENGKRALYSIRLHLALSFILGTLWGSCLFILAPEAGIYTASVLTVIVVGVCTCSMLVQLSNPNAWILQISPAIGLHAVYLYTDGTNGHFQLATLTLVYSILMAVVAVRLKNYFHDNVAAQHALQVKHAEILDKNARLYKLAHYDGLTGAANRKLLITAANDQIEAAARNGKSCAFLLIDLDHFKHLNDTMGHAAGDELLSVVGARLKGCTRSQDMVARLGGDEFGVLITDLDTPAYAETVAKNILQSLDRPQQIQGAVLNCRASIGISHYPRHGVSITEMMNNADLALQAAKKRGRGTYQVCTDDLQLASVKKLTVESELRRALRKGNVGFHFQPIVDASNGKVTGAEALVRLTGDDETTSTAEDIIRVSSAVGLSDELTAALFHSFEEQGQALFEALPDLQKISMNLSPLELRSVTPVKCLEGILKRGIFTPDQLQIEITEQSILERGADQARRAIDQIEAMGIPIVMDDFGTGYSSLTHLKSLPISGIKIDKSFVRELNNDQRDAAIVRSLVGMCKGLGLKVTAEGVENFAQFEILRRLGCDFLQGYLFFKAGAVEELRQQVTASPRPEMAWMADLASREAAHDQPGITAAEISQAV